MTGTRARLGGSLGAVLILGLLTFPAGAFANTGEPIAQTGGMTATLPLFGTTLTVAVTLDTSTGNISGVALTPTGDFTATTTQPELVKYANTAGTTTVSVRAFGSSETIKARSGKLADFVGSGTWSADVFGTGSKSTVAYTIGDDGSGHPTLAIGTVTPASGITDTINTPKMETEDGDSSASGGVTFTYQGFVKRLTISVEVSAEDGHASLRISLRGKDRQKVTGTLAELAGARTWSAHLCDGTAVAVNYHVVDTAGAGSLAFDGATGAPATSKVFESNDKGSTSNDNGLRVTFDGTKVGVTIRLHRNEDGTFTLVVKGSSGRCGDHTKADSHQGDGHAGDRSGGGGTGDHSGDGSSSTSGDGGH